MQMRITRAMGAERCLYCGRFIARKDLGVTAHKISKQHMSDIAHDKCKAKAANNLAKMLSQKVEE